jgi:hypothetical protein
LHAPQPILSSEVLRKLILCCSIKNAMANS